MEEKILLKVAIICSLLGILILFLVDETISLKESKIESIDESKLDQSVKVKGIVNNFRIIKSLKLFELKDETGKIKVISFDKDLELTNGALIEVEGRVTEYRNELEIEASKIKVL